MCTSSLTVVTTVAPLGACVKTWDVATRIAVVTGDIAPGVLPLGAAVTAHHRENSLTNERNK